MERNDQVANLCATLLARCEECGISPTAFIKEKMLELQERKRIMVTPSKAWFNNNIGRYPSFAAKALDRDLSDEEIYSDEGLLALVKRRLNPVPRELERETALKRLLLQESNGRCRICGVPITIHTMTIDHTIPLAEGGSNHTLNLQATCQACNTGKADYFAETAEASARPWWESRRDLLGGSVTITPTKRFCVLMRDGSSCRNCGIRARDRELEVVLRVSISEGGQPIYDNLLTLCSACAKHRSAVKKGSPY
ncbi:MAG: HNH endonuclease [Promethearchaeati archaeon]